MSWKGRYKVVDERMGRTTMVGQLMEVLGRIEALGKIRELAIHGKIALLENDRAELGKVLMEIAELAGE